MRSADELDALLEQALRPPAVPRPALVWPDVRRAIGRAEQDRRRGAVLRVVLAVLALLVLSTTAGVAASPGLREQLRDRFLGGAAMSGNLLTNEITGLRPLPDFTVLQPGDLPPGMALVGQGYNPGMLGGEGFFGAGGWAGKPDLDPALVREILDRVRLLMDEPPEAALVLVYAAPPDRIAELVQRPAAGKTLPAGDPVTVRGLPATRRRADGREVLAWIEGDTYLELHTTLEPDAARRIVTGLRPTRLTLARPRSTRAPNADNEAG